MDSNAGQILAEFSNFCTHSAAVQLLEYKLSLTHKYACNTAKVYRYLLRLGTIPFNLQVDL